MGATKPLWFDREALLAAHGGREEHLGKILRTYLREAPRTLAALANAVAQKDAEQIELAAHHVAGELLALHARPVAALARQIEHAAAAGRVQGTPRLLKALEGASQELLVTLVPVAVGLERIELQRGHAVVEAREEPEVVYVYEDLALGDMLGDDVEAANEEPEPEAAAAEPAAPEALLQSDEIEITFAAGEF